MTAKSLHHTLLRPAILQILRAQGFHAARPSVVDTLTDIAGRYLALLCERTAAHSWQNHNNLDADISDVRLALIDCGLLIPTQTGTEETWTEILRKPLQEYTVHNSLREEEKGRRDEDDTRAVREFANWFAGTMNREIRKIAGLLPDDGEVVELEGPAVKEDYLTVLKKKHSKTGDETRFAGTVLGKEADSRPVVIDGGPKSIQEWHAAARQQAAKSAASRKNTEVQSSAGSEDTVMEEG
jgi:transcription initiation factor TFIID subunit 3